MIRVERLAEEGPRSRSPMRGMRDGDLLRPDRLGRQQRVAQRADTGLKSFQVTSTAHGFHIPWSVMQ